MKTIESDLLVTATGGTAFGGSSPWPRPFPGPQFPGPQFPGPQIPGPQLPPGSPGPTFPYPPNDPIAAK